MHIEHLIRPKNNVLKDGYPIEHVNLYWDDKTPVSLIDELNLREYEITEITQSVCLLQFNQTGWLCCDCVTSHKMLKYE